MALRFFTVPIVSASESETEINAFVASHKVLTIDRKWVDLGASSYWAICVEFISGGSPATASATGIRSRVDYKDVLTPDEFVVFSRLRSLRKQLAQEDAVPVYTVFTNEQLAQIVQRRCRSRSDLQQIEGLGEGRIEKYAERLLPLLGERDDISHAEIGAPV